MPKLPFIIHNNRLTQNTLKTLAYERYELIKNSLERESEQLLNQINQQLNKKDQMIKKRSKYLIKGYFTAILIQQLNQQKSPLTKPLVRYLQKPDAIKSSSALRDKKIVELNSIKQNILPVELFVDHTLDPETSKEGLTAPEVLCREITALYLPHTDVSLLKHVILAAAFRPTARIMVLV